MQNEFKRANINYDINQKLSSDYSIKSSINGKVYDILKERGELVTPQTPLAVIGKADTFLLELAVDENDIIKISTGLRGRSHGLPKYFLNKLTTLTKVTKATKVTPIKYVYFMKNS